MPEPSQHVTSDDLAELEQFMLAQRERLDTQEHRVDELIEGLRIATLCLLGGFEQIRPEGGQ